MREFYVIEVNKGDGATGVYLSISGLKKTGIIYRAIKFFDKESAKAVYDHLGFTLKDWIITEHAFQD